MKIWLYPCLATLFFTACSLKESGLNSNPPQSISNFEYQQDSHYAKLEFDQNISILSKMNQNINFDSQKYKQLFFSPWHSSFKTLKNQNLF
ncbi:TPA: hypothetical protein RZH79_001744, partial [Campylobacter coli]|nr:hypothetical protein [Campylobacter coli]